MRDASILCVSLTDLQMIVIQMNRSREETESLVGTGYEEADEEAAEWAR
jgi:hypothetical protein